MWDTELKQWDMGGFVESNQENYIIQQYIGIVSESIICGFS